MFYSWIYVLKVHFIGILQHLKDRNDPVMEEILLETERMLAYGRMDVPLSLCFAAMRGDDLLLHQLLKKGLDPNELDRNGRTPLVYMLIYVYTYIKILDVQARIYID